MKAQNKKTRTVGKNEYVAVGCPTLPLTCVILLYYITRVLQVASWGVIIQVNLLPDKMEKFTVTKNSVISKLVSGIFLLLMNINDNNP